MATSDSRDGWILWPTYDPSLGPAIAFCTIFGIASAVHGVLRIQKRKAYATPLIIGGIFEAISYGFRVRCHYHPDEAAPQSLHAVFSLVAPNFFAAAIYFYGSHIIRASGVPNLSVFNPTRLARVLAGVDMLSFVVLVVSQGIYNGLQTDHGEKLGKALVVIGLLIQLFNLIVFIALIAIFHVRFRKSDIAKEHPTGAKKVQRLLLLTYKLCISVWGRNIFVLTITGMGPTGYLSRQEWWRYAFDGGQMIVVMLFALIWYFYDIDMSEMAVGHAVDATTPGNLKGPSEAARLDL